MGKMIGYTKEWEGLYLLEACCGNSDGLPLSYLYKKISSNKDQIWLSSKIGTSTLSFAKKKMFSLLFENLDVNIVHCEVCELAKHHQTPFPLNDKKCFHPFTLIHIDAWGSFKNSKYCWF